MRTATDAPCPPRRRFLRAAAAAAGLTVAACAAARPDEDGDEREEGEDGEIVTPGEDLMQEHGVLERVLLVYEEAAGRLERSADLDPAIVTGAAGIVRDFVESYHEKLEETFVFPRLEQAGREVELVSILRAQHAAGRGVTAGILLAADVGPRGGTDLSKLLRSFVRMYRPHAAREDTVLFPAFRSVVGGKEYLELGERFEEREHELLGEDGFAGAVAQVHDLEHALGIDDLGSFTPA